MYMNGWGLVLIAVVIAAGMLLCRVRGSAQTPCPTALAFAALALIAAVFGLLVYGIGLTGTGAVFAAASFVVPAAVYVAAVWTQMRTTAAASSRIPRKAPATARRPIGDVQPARARKPVAAARPVFVDIPDVAEDRRNRPPAKAEAEVVQKRTTEKSEPRPERPAVAPLLPMRPASQSSSLFETAIESKPEPEFGSVPEPKPHPAPGFAAEPKPKPKPKPHPAPEPKLEFVSESESRPEPQPEAQADPQPRPEPPCEIRLAKARSFKAKGELAIAARLFAQAAELAADDSARRSALFEQLSCLVKSNAAAQAHVVAEQLRSDGACPTAAERIKLDAVERMM